MWGMEYSINLASCGEFIMLKLSRSTILIVLASAAAIVTGCAGSGTDQAVIRPPANTSTETDAAVGSPQAQTACHDTAQPFLAGMGTTSSLILARPTTVGQLVSWQQTRQGPNGPSVRSQWASHNASQKLTFCLFSGSYAAVMAPPGESLPDYTRAAVIIGDSDGPAIEYLSHDNDGPETPAPAAVGS
jgi:hypothetical protein